jgi:hypothetical protein
MLHSSQLPKHCIQLHQQNFNLDTDSYMPWDFYFDTNHADTIKWCETNFDASAYEFFRTMQEFRTYLQVQWYVSFTTEEDYVMFALSQGNTIA